MKWNMKLKFLSLSFASSYLEGQGPLLVGFFCHPIGTFL
jgi:hypothetical protein